ncbi:5690_t:CDS:2 [Ambispora gerdemannii]|uniref:5690_t:CDS:1 n=1 Tax=Ambispora gerdemannii TaxID=144530 RepID=A0A9N8ZUS1_9GLOM|nr:5690_t:CDS:2 [Ambispora gerdemannii]
MQFIYHRDRDTEVENLFVHVELDHYHIPRAPSIVVMELSVEKGQEQQKETCSFPFESDEFSNYICENQDISLCNFKDQLHDKGTDKEESISTPTNTMAEYEKSQLMLNVQDVENISAVILNIFDSLGRDRGGEEGGTEDNQS